MRSNAPGDCRSRRTRTASPVDANATPVGMLNGLPYSVGLAAPGLPSVRSFVPSGVCSRDRMHAGIGDPHMAGRIDGHAMHEDGELAFAPRRDEAAVGIEHHHGMRRARQHIDIAIGGGGSLHAGLRRAGYSGRRRNSTSAAASPSCGGNGSDNRRSRYRGPGRRVRSWRVLPCRAGQSRRRVRARYSSSSGVLTRPRIALRCGKRPNRRITSRWLCACCSAVSPSSPAQASNSRAASS